MSKKRNKASRRTKSSGGGGLLQEPIKVNWWVIGGVVVALALIVYYSVSQSGKPTASAGAGTGDCSNGPTSRQYASAPEMTIDPAKQYTATFTLEKGGDFVVQLYPDKAPITVNSFVFLAREGYFNCVTFHRVLDGFMAQGGDPTGTGSGGPGYQFEDETSNGLVFDRAGLLAMANSGPNTNGSQFFITFASTDWLNGNHTIFGEVVEGMDVVNGLTRRDPGDPSAPPSDVIQSVTIVEN